ncbi:hypothetical protein D3C81_1673970 [compost metagenome]
MAGNISGITSRSLSPRCSATAWMQPVIFSFSHWRKASIFHSTNCSTWRTWVASSFLCSNNLASSCTPPLKKKPANGAIWLKFSTRPCTCGAIFIRYSGLSAHFCTSLAKSSTASSRIH